ncbi:MAG: hypothetical protein ACREAA_10650 [Candidatus Polarisedimenticolia bacterium]
MSRCEIPRCREEADVIYLGRGVCERHWNKYTADDAPVDALRVVLGLPPAPVAAAMEDVMDDGTKTSKAEGAVAPVKSKGKSKKAAPPKTVAKREKPAIERTPRVREQFDGEVVVFAFRLGSNDRDRIHAAAGPAGATKFVRAAALAAAGGDRDAFDTLVTQARANLK